MRCKLYRQVVFTVLVEIFQFVVHFGLKTDLWEHKAWILAVLFKKFIDRNVRFKARNVTEMRWIRDVFPVTHHSELLFHISDSQGVQRMF